MNKYDLVIFDFDGTLMDTGVGVRTAVDMTLRHFGLAELSEKELNVFIGPPFNVQISRMFDLSQEKIWEVTNYFRALYSGEYLLKADYYEGILETIDALRERGIKTAVATYKREDYAKAISDHFHFTERMDCVEGCDHFGKLSKNDIIENSIRNSGITDYSRVLMVGDTVNDSDGAKKIGVDFVAALYGFGFEKEEEREASGAIGFIQKPEELLELV